ncbi:MAG: nucleotidyltransferase family protein [Phycisphaerae bacterium]|nr:nucleotidyltransferase family protein [Phycisphaerae bacterium]
MPVASLLQDKREAILSLAARHGVRNVRIFGSAARGDTGPDSDFDFLVDLDADRSLLDLGGLLMDLRELLEREVDIVTERSLHWYIRDRILREAVPL